MVLEFGRKAIPYGAIISSVKSVANVHNLAEFTSTQLTKETIQCNIHRTVTTAEALGDQVTYFLCV